MSIIFRQLFDYETWTYTYLVACPHANEAVLIDTVKEQVDRDMALLKDLGLRLKYVLDTHVHADHVTGSGRLRELTGCKVGVGKPGGVSCADLQLEDGQVLEYGRHSLRVIATPGHTNTCMSFYTEGRVFTGDVLFVRDCGRTDFQEGSNEKMWESVTKKLFGLPPETLVYPGHDYKGYTCSSVDEEKRLNPKLGGGKTFAEFAAKMAEMKLGTPKKLHIAVPANLKCGLE